MRDLESWLEEQTVRQAATPLATESVAALQLQLQENKVGCLQFRSINVDLTCYNPLLGSLLHVERRSRGIAKMVA